MQPVGGMAGARDALAGLAEAPALSADFLFGVDQRNVVFKLLERAVENRGCVT